MKLSLAEYLAMEARLARNSGKRRAQDATAGDLKQKSESPQRENGKSNASESELHAEISAYCRSKGWYVIHSRMDRRQTAGIGTPDYVIVGHGGRVWFIEAKRRGGKATREQAAVGVMLTYLGVKYSLVHDMAQFLDAVK